MKTLLQYPAVAAVLLAIAAIVTWRVLRSLSGESLPFPPESTGAAEPPPQDPERRVRELLAKGNKIAAIKLYREVTGVGLKEAKEAIDSLETSPERRLFQRGDAGGAPGAEAMSDLEREVLTLLASGEKIRAIKVYREATGRDLKDSKDAVEALDRSAAARQEPSRL